MKMTSDAAMYQQAATFLQRGNFAKAGELCANLLNRQPRQPDILHLAALAAKGAGDPLQAERHFRASLAAKPRQPAVSANLANLLKQLGKTDEAIGFYRKAVAQDPAFINAWYGLALALYENNQHGEAAKAVKKLLAQARQVAAFEELNALIAWRLGEVDEALHAFECAVKLDEKSFRCWFNFGNFLRETERFGDAVAAYRKAIECGMRTEAVFANLAETLADTGQPEAALAILDEALDEHPLSEKAHYTRAKFSWESTGSATHLDRLEAALAKYPETTMLWSSLFDLLSHEKRYDRILEYLPQARRHCGDQLRFMLVEAVALSGSGKNDAAKAIYEKLLRLDPAAVAPRLSFAEFLLKCREFERSAALCEDVLRSDKYNQRALAFLATAWQQLGDERWHWLVDAERSIRTYEMEPPAGFASLAEFLAELAAVLNAKHGMLAHPLDQTLRGGTQTNGFLFRTMNKTLLAFEREIRRICERHIQTFPTMPEHPFWGRNTGRFELNGAWSVRLRAQGFHTNHFHSEGWISSACYASLPKEIVGGEGTAGYIQFGVPPAELGLEIEPFKIVKPQEGRIVLFPSYMWHGTLPFESERPRLTAAFDVSPA